MFIIWGTKGTSKVQGVTRTEYQCEHCGVVSRWKYISLKNWFTLFFIPIIPYGNKKALICPICDNGFEINKYNEWEILQQVNMF